MHPGYQKIPVNRLEVIKFAGIKLFPDFLVWLLMTMTEAEVLKALSNVQDPDLGKDLVTLNMGMLFKYSIIPWKFFVSIIC